MLKIIDISRLGAATLLVFCGVFCQKEVEKNDFPGFRTPAHFPAPVYDFEKNKATEAGFALGKKLFYDPILSRDGTISCGSCHQQVAAFAHQSHDFSHGVDDRTGARNAPALQNLAWSSSFGWDGGVPHLDLFPLNPIENPVEMDEKISRVLEKLRARPEYPHLFKAAFGNPDIDTDRLTRALSQFQLLLVSAGSRYDTYINGNINVFNAEETAGLQVFRQHCTGCHTEPLFTDNTFRNNGLSEATPDLGRYAVSLDPADIGRFKTPSLRNVEKSGPYMHDGRIRKLEDAVEHYRTGIQVGKTLDPLLRNRIALTEREKTQLIAFLKTLTDSGFLADPRWGE